MNRFFAPSSFWALIVSAAFGAQSGRATMAQVSISVLDFPRNSFGGVEAVVRVSVLGIRDTSARVSWSLEAAEHRAIARGEAALPDGGNLPVRLRLPPVKEGAVLGLRLRASVAIAPGDKVAATTEEKLWVFPESPWTNSGESLRRANIMVFDPAGLTAKLLTAGGVPFEETRNVAALGQAVDGLVLIGQETDFREYPDLMGTMLRAAASGATVVCLAPQRVNWPLQDDARPRGLSSLSFRREDVISELDPRLDVLFWTNGQPTSTHGLSLHCQTGKAALETTDDGDAWPWVDARIGSGRVIICGMDICYRWGASPAPRFLLAELLKLAPTRDNSPSHRTTDR